MLVEFMHPLRLLAFPVCAVIILVLCLFRKSRSRYCVTRRRVGSGE